MADAYKRLGAVEVAATTNTSIYSPSSKEAIITEISICNQNATPVTVRLAHIDGLVAAIANADYMLYGVTLSGNSSIILTPRLAVADGHTIMGYASATNVVFVCSGIERSNSPDKAYKRLGGTVVVAATDTTLYTVPASTQAIVTQISICNIGSTNRTFRLAHVDGAIGAVADADYIFYDTYIGPNEAILLNTNICMAATHTLLCRASHAEIVFNCSGLELTN